MFSRSYTRPSSAQTAKASAIGVISPISLGLSKTPFSRRFKTVLNERISFNERWPTSFHVSYMITICVMYSKKDLKSERFFKVRLRNSLLVIASYK